jgi:hypothetical protein
MPEERFCYDDIDRSFWPPSNKRKRRKVRARAADGLHDLRSAAARLNATPAKVRAFVEAGQLKYVNVGLGKKYPRYRFAESDLDALIAAKTSQESIAPCPSSKPRRAVRSIGTASIFSASDFLARRNARNARKP